MDQFADHARLLKGERVDLDPNEPCSGWFRMRRVKGGPFVPVQVTWEGDFGDIEILLDGRLSTPEGIGWPYTGKNAIPKASYDYFMKHRKWPDVDDVVHIQQASNNPPTDPAVILAEQIESARAGAAAYDKIESDEDAARAQTLRSRLIELSGQADKLRVAEKEPHLEAGRKVDAKWQPLVRDAKTAADAIRTAMSTWETAKLAKRRQEEAAAQEAFRREQEAIAKAAAVEAAKTGKPAVVVVPPPSAPPPAAPRRIKGGAGRAASVGVVRVVQNVQDWPALFMHFREYDEVKMLLVKFANEQLKLGNQVPGVVVAERADVK